MMARRGAFAGVCFVVVLMAASPVFGDDGAVEVENGPSLVRVLTDKNFEHDTQAVTGATTGDWLIEFYAPWCGHCKRLEETWEKLAIKLDEDRQAGEARPIVAKVDATQEKETAERFKIGGFPTLVMLSKGKMYNYDGGRDLDSLYAWCKDRAFQQSESVAVPKGWDQKSPLEKLNDVFEATIKNDMIAIWNYHKAAFFVGLAAAFLLGLILGALLCGSKRAAGASPVKPSGSGSGSSKDKSRKE